MDERARVIDEDISGIDHAMRGQRVATIIAVGMDVKDAAVEANETASNTKNAGFDTQGAGECVLTRVTEGRGGGSLGGNGGGCIKGSGCCDDHDEDFGRKYGACVRAVVLELSIKKN